MHSSKQSFTIGRPGYRCVGLSRVSIEASRKINNGNYSLFTFGREHEKKCATEHLRNAFKVKVASTLIDAIHDLIEGIGSKDKVHDAIRIAFAEGGSGVWESTGSWLRKLGAEYPDIRGLWVELAQHPRAMVRFRIACFLDVMPTKEFTVAAKLLSADKSKKVTNMADSRIEEVAARARARP